jgi:hypothetical protein
MGAPFIAMSGLPGTGNDKGKSRSPTGMTTRKAKRGPVDDLWSASVLLHFASVLLYFRQTRVAEQQT